MSRPAITFHLYRSRTHDLSGHNYHADIDGHRWEIESKRSSGWGARLWVAWMSTRPITGRTDDEHLRYMDVVDDSTLVRMSRSDLTEAMIAHTAKVI